MGINKNFCLLKTHLSHKDKWKYLILDIGMRIILTEVMATLFKVMAMQTNHIINNHYKEKKKDVLVKILNA